MESNINFTAIVLVNLLAITLIVETVLSNRITLRRKNAENRLILGIMFCIFLCCCADTAVFYSDGKPGFLNHCVAYWGNWFEYLMNMVVCPLWAFLVDNHVSGAIPKRRIVIRFSMIGVGLLMLFSNFFFPIIFYVDSNNVYSRGPLQVLFGIIEGFFVLDCIVTYAKAKITGGVFKFFPVWQFVVPTVMGVLIQTAFYGVSVIWAFMAVAISCVIFSIQNEKIYMDALTGLYNRPYLDYVKREVARKKVKYPITMMMLDMDGFKKINDNFGHHEGDYALISASKILKEAVGELGSIIRFAGDEFVILLNTTNADRIQHCIDAIQAGMKDFNDKKNKGYVLSVSIGVGELDLSANTIDEIFEYIDQRMYEEKRNK